MEGPENKNISTEEQLNHLYETGIVKQGMPAPDYEKNAQLFINCLYGAYDKEAAWSMQLHKGERWFRNHKIKDVNADGAFYWDIGLIQHDFRVPMAQSFRSVQDFLGTTDCYTTINCFAPSDPKQDRFGRRRDDRATASVTAYTGYLIDIDFHNIQEADTMDAALQLALKYLIRALNDKAIPVPTMMVMSGRGFQIYYLYSVPISSADMDAVEHHTAIYQKLFTRFKKLFPMFDIDTTVRDGSRVCRVAGCLHSKTGKHSSLLFYDGPRYEQDDIVDLFDLDKIPDNIIEIKKEKKARRKNTASVKSAENKKQAGKNKTKIIKERRFRVSGKIGRDVITGYGYLADDIIRFIKHRKGDMTGRRELALHILYNCCRCHGDSVQDAYKTISDMNSIFTDPLDEAEVCNAMRTARYDWYGRDYYDYNRVTVFNLLEMTEEENEELKLVPELLTEKHNREALERDKTICKLYKEGYTPEDIALIYQGKRGYSKRTIYRTIYDRYHLDRENVENSYQRYGRNTLCQHLTISMLRRVVRGAFVDDRKKLAVIPLPDDTSVREGIDKALKYGYNTFINGSSGTGKTYIVDAWGDTLSDDDKVKMAFLSYTGRAAKNLNVQGMTLHSFLGVRKADGPVIRPGTIYSQGVNNILKYSRIVVDEISMIRLDLFEALCRLIDYVWTAYRHYVQLVILGDWYQIGPYASDEDVRLLKEWYPGYCMGFANESVYWQKMDLVQYDIYQTKRFVDPVFRQACTNLEYGFDIERTVEYLNSLDGTPDEDAVFVCGLNKTVNDINNCFAMRFPESERHCYSAWSEGAYRENRNVIMAAGMPVMFVRNDHKRGVVNGSSGVITKCHKNSVTVLVEGKELLVKVTKQGIPLVPGYAITVNKAQGMTFDKMNLVIDEVFQPAQLSVAVSRCRSAEGLHILGRDITVDDVILSPLLTQDVRDKFAKKSA